MKKHLWHRVPAGLLLTSTFLYSGLAYSVENNNTTSTEGDGFTLLSGVPNENNWGLGVGLGFEKKPYTGADSNLSPFPLVYFDNKWIALFGNRIDLKIGKWENIKISLHGQYAFDDGYKESDAPILYGMQKRGGGFWVGPAAEWNTDFGTVSAKYLFAGNKGQKASLGFDREFEYGSFTFTPHTEIEWFNNKYVGYYYGVRPSEVQPGRDIYSGRSTYKISAGLRTNYSITPSQSVSLDATLSRLGSGISDSPLVDKTTIPQVTLGYFYRF
ncbi:MULTISPECIES: MipA/OmpV family protein [Pectobacterium]|uniref:MipA/OmpV family protein n=1 Tax=Pectobacterium aquaticum TaxID=2204145 RepID=A0AA93AQM5_9GAMM|nr:MULTISPECIES: MipA/OmpV family protein [Pectobacterium]MBA0173807.1 MipA/OmpV family protein [Pectobacterium versatile]QQG27680.1 MipA/OmpV family protein [Pectobacterium carotovorum]RRO05163.1 MipA/OmpV family protein [Pectobacterium aquaticum]RRO25332.1 MipA/OmpV family protein [Pectobacterium aquaticum]